MFLVQPDGSSLISICREQLLNLRLDRSFALFALQGAGERKLLHHQLMQNRLMLRIRRPTESGEGPREIKVRQQPGWIKPQNRFQPVYCGLIISQLQLTLSEA